MQEKTSKIHIFKKALAIPVLLLAMYYFSYIKHFMNVWILLVWITMMALVISSCLLEFVKYKNNKYLLLKQNYMIKRHLEKRIKVFEELSSLLLDCCVMLFLIRGLIYNILQEDYVTLFFTIITMFIVAFQLSRSYKTYKSSLQDFREVENDKQL